MLQHRLNKRFFETLDINNQRDKYIRTMEPALVKQEKNDYAKLD